MVEQNWQPPKSDHVRLVARSEALIPVRVASVFADKTETGGQVPAVDDGQTGLLDKSRDVVLLDDVSVTDGCSYYEQIHVTAGWIKLGVLYSSASRVFLKTCWMFWRIWTKFHRTKCHNIH